MAWSCRQQLTLVLTNVKSELQVLLEAKLHPKTYCHYNSQRNYFITIIYSQQKSSHFVRLKLFRLYYTGQRKAAILANFPFKVTSNQLSKQLEINLLLINLSNEFCQLSFSRFCNCNKSPPCSCQNATGLKWKTQAQNRFRFVPDIYYCFLDILLIIEKFYSSHSVRSISIQTITYCFVNFASAHDHNGFRPPSYIQGL